MKFLILYLIKKKKSRAFKDRCKKQCGYLIYLFEIGASHKLYTTKNKCVE